MLRRLEDDVADCHDSAHGDDAEEQENGEKRSHH
jgi:hypothetical protein